MKRWITGRRATFGRDPDNQAGNLPLEKNESEDPGIQDGLKGTSEGGCQNIAKPDKDVSTGSSPAAARKRGCKEEKETEAEEHSNQQKPDQEEEGGGHGAGGHAFRRVPQGGV